jgi:hypothetical protein
MKNATEAVDSMAGLSIGGTELGANGQSLRLLHEKVGQYQKAMGREYAHGLHQVTMMNDLRGYELQCAMQQQ